MGHRNLVESIKTVNLTEGFSADVMCLPRLCNEIRGFSLFFFDKKHISFFIFARTQR